MYTSCPVALLYWGAGCEGGGHNIIHFIFAALLLTVSRVDRSSVRGVHGSATPENEVCLFREDDDTG